MPATIAARIASAIGQPILTQSTPTMAEESPLIEPTERSISPSISTQTMPSGDDADGGAVEQQVDEVVWRQKHRVEQREHRRDNDQADEDRQHAEIARAYAVEEGLDHAHDVVVVADAFVAAIQGSRLAYCVGHLLAHADLSAGFVAAALRSIRAGDGVFGGAGDGGDEFLVGRVGREDAVVAAEAQHDDAVGHGAHVFHVVADDDDAEAALAHAFDQVQHFGGLGDAEGRRRLVEHDDLRVEQQRAGDGDGLALAAGKRGDRLAHARECGRQAR